ncbi:hypothetical protein [Hymenobacter ginkgonis]|nr:hypothetical protein [Hymenobacter ginkgonis]
MKLLLDEALSHKLRYRLRLAHKAVPAQGMGWRGKENGDLLKLLA